jgi:hypothetical protein
VLDDSIASLYVRGILEATIALARLAWRLVWRMLDRSIDELMSLGALLEVRTTF